MNHDIILKLLEEKETNLINELNQLRHAIDQFKENSGFLFPDVYNYNLIAELIRMRLAVLTPVKFFLS